MQELLQTFRQWELFLLQYIAMGAPDITQGVGDFPQASTPGGPLFGPFSAFASVAATA